MIRSQTIQASVLRLVAIAVAIPSLASAQDTQCQEFEKQVSVDGGVTWQDADSVLSAPTVPVGTAIVYRFLVTNCLPDKDCVDTTVEDPDLGIPRTLVGDNGFLGPGDSVIVTQDDPGFENLDQPDRCDTPGTKINTATERTREPTHARFEEFMDQAYVVCVEGDDARLGDYVWEDLNGDGEQDPNEPGIDGVPVDLLGPGPDGVCGTGNEVPIDSTTTDAAGFYLFDGLPPGDYCVEFPEDPADALDCGPDSSASYTTRNAPGVDPADDSNAMPDGTTAGVSLAAGDEDLTIDAGLYCSASLGDTLWNDLNRDGVQDSLNLPGGEPGINGVNVSLFTCVGDQVGAPIQTGPAPLDAAFPQVPGEPGWYEFTGLAPGCYVVQFDQPAGFVFSDADATADEELDSDVNPGGSTGFITLASGDSDPTNDAGVNQPPAGLGDFVFEDLNADGIQDPGEPGIPDVPVALLTPGDDGLCNTPDDETTGQTTITDAQGGYKFEGLDPGSYCVEFDKSRVDCRSNGFDLGMANFSPQEAGSDRADDSNPDTATGVSGNVELDPGEFDPTIDAGLFCPAKLGDRVWEDTNRDGLQDPNEPGVEDVMVTLVDCGPDGMVGGGDDDETGEKRTTNGGDGMYMFGGEPGIFDLPPGSYYVKFMDPDGREFTTPGGTPDDRNSDCRPPDGATTCVELGSKGVDLGLDCGLLPPPPPECNLVVDKTCRVETPPAPAFDGSCKGRIQEFTMVWDGPGVVDLVTEGSLTASTSSVAPGDEVTFFNNGGGQNDVFVQLSGAVNGRSNFHLSCSDDDMDADTDSNDEQPQVSQAGQDCGKFAGNGKDKAGFVNQWLFEGLVDAEGKVLDCTPPDDMGGFSQSCEFEKSVVSCETTGKPSSLTLLYSGIGPVGDCTDNSATAANQKPPTCSGNLPAGATVAISLNGDSSEAMVGPGETFVITGYGSQTEVTLTSGGASELDSFHTSCSAPLAAGDVFGNLTVVGFDGQNASATVTYQYEVTNLGDALTSIAVSDDKLGPIGTIASLPDANGNSAVLTATTAIDQTTTNTAMASGVLADGTVCSAPAASVTVTAVEPTCDVSVTFKEAKDDEVKFYLENVGPITATLESLQLSFPAGFEAIKEVELDGDIYKSKESSSFPDGVPSGATIGAADWTEDKVSKRQLEAEERRELKIKFTEKFKDATSSDFSGSGIFAEGCSVSID